MTTPHSDPVLACNIHAIPPQMRPAHAAHIQRLMASVQEAQALPTGYALRLPNETEIVQTIMAFLAYERLCCPFFHFVLDIQPEQGPIWLQVTGAVDIKPFVQSAFGLSENRISS
jgi:hypothetical protein